MTASPSKIERALLEIIQHGRGLLDRRAIESELRSRADAAGTSIVASLESLASQRLVRKTMADGGNGERWGLTASGRERLQQLLLQERATGQQPARLVTADEETLLEFESGAAHAPDSDGLRMLVISRDGRARFAHQLRDQIQHASGRIEKASLDALLERLEHAGFPIVPAHDLVPGGGHARIVLHRADGIVAAEFLISRVRREPAYREVLDLLARWIARLSAAGDAEVCLS